MSFVWKPAATMLQAFPRNCW